MFEMFQCRLWLWNLWVAADSGFFIIITITTFLIITILFVPLNIIINTIIHITIIMIVTTRRGQGWVWPGTRWTAGGGSRATPRLISSHLVGDGGDDDDCHQDYGDNHNLLRVCWRAWGSVLWASRRLCRALLLFQLTRPLPQIPRQLQRCFSDGFVDNYQDQWSRFLCDLDRSKRRFATLRTRTALPGGGMLGCMEALCEYFTLSNVFFRDFVKVLRGNPKSRSARVIKWSQETFHMTGEDEIAIYVRRGVLNSK